MSAFHVLDDNTITSCTSDRTRLSLDIESYLCSTGGSFDPTSAPVSLYYSPGTLGLPSLDAMGTSLGGTHVVQLLVRGERHTGDS